MSNEIQNSDSNPCLQEQKLSLKCLQDNFGDKTKCEPEIENYKDCKTFWYDLFRERKRNNIKPYMPSLKERIEIKKEFMSGHTN
ncbi:Hypothetical protein CINCED_3A007185 [Cinara cedri]|nr:Hypothetical protein CINCED_3A007185 [Cinara cedri]